VPWLAKKAVRGLVGVVAAEELADSGKQHGEFGRLRAGHDDAVSSPPTTSDPVAYALAPL
jgi:hypothetical protein